MKKLILIALLFAMSEASAGNKFHRALSIEQICAKGFQFIHSAPSTDKKSTRWVFYMAIKLIPEDSLPVYVDVGEKPSEAELEIATIAAVSEARVIQALLEKAAAEKAPENSPKLYY
jgi:hypothetical protein